jgi:PAS domain S-box-containing protein
MSPEETQQTMHELRVRQIELELQNEELRRVQLDLDLSRENYFDFYDRAPVGYCTVSESGLILQINLSAASLLGIARRELNKRPISRFFAREDQDGYYLYRKRLLATGEPQSGEFRMIKNDGTPFWAHLEATVAQDTEGAPLLRFILSDITERKQLDQVLQEKLTELEYARRAADKANLAKSQFLSNMSHELRSPLNTILGFAQLMAAATPAPPPSQTARIDHILEAGWYLLTLINEILDLSMIESGHLALTLEPIALADVLSDCQSMVELEAEKRNINLQFPQFNKPIFVNADRTRLKQVLINLLTNAIKYNRTGGSVQVLCRELPAQRVRISVQDSGEGLPPEQLGQLFQPFNRLGKESSTVEGTGIGLVVSKRLVEAMEGTIGVQSALGLGCVFWIELIQIMPPDPIEHA